jgi:hypothetical protein
MFLKKEPNMGEQLELFETQHSQWVRRRWQLIPPETRSEIIEVLAQMGKAALQARRAVGSRKSKGAKNEP